MNSKKKATKLQENINMASTDSMKFETALAELESVILKLERDDLELDTALSCFERGVCLMRICDAQLHYARGKITELFKGEDGAFAEKVLGISLESFLNEEKEHD
jgi:exodeoxyribonuclease VII small subunit